jgi:general secretion pathway protein G
MVRRIRSGSSRSLTFAALFPRQSRDREGAVQSAAPNSWPLRRGFTFIELMVVMAIIVVLITMAIPVYQKSITRAKESVLKNNLFTIRTVIDNYTYDKQKAPQSLQELVTEGYLREIPVDPMLASNQGWRIIMEDATQAVNQDSPGIFDVRSGSDKLGLDGTPYADW